MATHNVAIQEYMGHPEPAHEAFPHAWTFSDGHLDPGDAPGLGVELDEKVLLAHPYDAAHLPVARALDGTLTDW